MALPILRRYKLPKVPVAPTKRIVTDEDVIFWRTTAGYQDYGLFIRRLNLAVIGYDLPYAPRPHTLSEAVHKTIQMLDKIATWVDEIPPQETTQRFGNLAFRDWGKRLEEQSATLLETLLPRELHKAIPLVQPYLLQSFGSFGRIDYGTGHELAFGLFLCVLTLLRFFHPDEEEERALVLIIFEKYLQIVWKLQDVYKLEPAGSHGVWGLDDYCFLPYIWGSGQVQEHLVSRPPDVLSPPLAETTLYNQAINRIHKLKTGPFQEHSSQLHSIASVPTWWKVNQGLFKMYEAEVLGKRVVVQHLPLGGVLEWGEATEADEEEEEVAKPNPTLLTAPGAVMGGSTHSSPGSNHEPLPGSAISETHQGGSSPMSSANMLPPVQNLSLSSPVRQNSMPRPKGGRLAAALAASPQTALSPQLEESEGEGSPKSKPKSKPPVVTRTQGEDAAAETAAEPDLKKESEVLEPPTSPQNVAKILTAVPVDHRLMSSSNVAAATPAPAAEPTTGEEPASKTTSQRRQMSAFERIATLLGCGRRK